MLPSEIPRLPTDMPVRWFHGIWKLLLRLPSRDRSLSLTLLPLFLSFIFCPTSFQRQCSAFVSACCPLPAFRNCFVKFAQCSNVLSLNLQRSKWSPHPIPPPSLDHPLEINSFSLASFATIFFHSEECLQLAYNFLCFTRAFKFSQSHLLIFKNYHYFERRIRESLAVIYVGECFAYVFLWEFYSFWPYVQIFNPSFGYFCVV